MRVYVDANVLLDFLLDRRNLFGRSLGGRAAKFFQETLECKHFLIISDHTLYELEKHKINLGKTSFIWLISKKIESVKTTERDKEDARKLNPSNYPDALHVILAKKAKAEVIVTRNLEDFVGYFPCSLPEDL
ncbi:MAG: PIN domain-containing protein [Candidatus Diapherotrites archaeon]|nr:PIN domain-containing protein [Candidatus Diapherotrites archaeon]